MGYKFATQFEILVETEGIHFASRRVQNEQLQAVAVPSQAWT